MICAFSNDLAGNGSSGYLIIGAYDNGELSGLRVDDRLLLKISNIRTDGNILPQPFMTVEKFIFETGDLLVVEVLPSVFPPVRYRGRTWVRVGPRKSVASDGEEKQLSERRLLHVKSFDALPCFGSTIDDLDIEIFKKEYLSKAVAADLLAEDKRDITEQLASLRFFDTRYNTPTNAAIILLGNKPTHFIYGSFIQYVRFGGVDKASDIVREYAFKGNLCSVLAKLDTFIDTTIVNRKPVLVSALREEMTFSYPYWATRELLMNAVIHRTYESNAPIQFYEYDDRIEILNHGGLYGKVSPENFPNINDYRNPIIASAIKVLGYVNGFSRGVSKVQRELRENGNGEAVFDLSVSSAFKVVEYRSLRADEIGLGATDIGGNDGDIGGDDGGNGGNDSRELVLEIIRINGGINRVGISEKLPTLASRTLQRHLKELKDDNLIEFVGTNRSGGYYIKQCCLSETDVIDSGGNDGGSGGNNGGNDGGSGGNDSRELVLEIIRINGGINRVGISEKLPTLASRTIQRHLKELKDDNLIEFVGTNRSGGYYIKNHSEG
ncbi:MAG: ATP-binding protein [Bacteroidales bacterium]